MPERPGRRCSLQDSLGEEAGLHKAWGSLQGPLLRSEGHRSSSRTSQHGRTGRGPEPGGEDPGGREGPRDALG